MEKLGRGRVLHQLAKMSHLSISEIVRKAGYKYSSFYVHINNDELAYDILYKYGIVLEHDFSREFPEMEGMFPDELNSRGSSKAELQEQLNTLTRDYISLLKRHNEVLEKYTALLEKFCGLSEEDRETN